MNIMFIKYQYMMFMISIHFTPQAVNRYCKNRKLFATKGLLRVMFGSG